MTAESEHLPPIDESRTYEIWPAIRRLTEQTGDPR